MAVAILTQFTPNPNAMKFILNRDVKSTGKVTFRSADEANGIALVEALFALVVVEQVHLFENVVTVTKIEQAPWEDVADWVKQVLTNHVEEHDPGFEITDAGSGGPVSHVRDDQPPEVQRIEEVLDLTRRQAEAKAPALGCSPYEALLDSYEPGARTDMIDRLFADLAAFLPGFLDRALSAQEDRRPLPLQHVEDRFPQVRRGLGQVDRQRAAARQADRPGALVLDAVLQAAGSALSGEQAHRLLDHRPLDAAAAQRSRHLHIRGDGHRSAGPARRGAPGGHHARQGEPGAARVPAAHRRLNVAHPDADTTGEEAARPGRVKRVAGPC